MKKFVCHALTVASILGVASCSQNDSEDISTGNATITIQLPQNQLTKGVFGENTEGDCAQLNNLQWAVFEITSGEGEGTTGKLVVSGSKTGSFANTDQVNISLNLAKGKTYQVAFYADDATNTFASFDKGILKVDYSKSISNNAAEDVFIGCSEQFSVNGAYKGNVTLSRPFAQLNWGTSDLDNTILSDLPEKLTATVNITQGLYSTMDILTGKLSDEVTKGVSYQAVDCTNLPSQNFPVEGFSLIAMNYLLTGDGTINCTLGFNNGLSAVVVNSAPVKKNARTNIYGPLLTSSTEFSVTVENSFITTSENIGPDAENP